MPHFPLSAWYAAAYDVELKRALLPRTICNHKIVLFRRENGQAAALEDACWHRLLPLSLGRLEGDETNGRLTTTPATASTTSTSTPDRCGRGG